MLPYRVHVNHGSQNLILEQRNLVDLVRGAKTIHDVQERHPSLERRRLRDQGEIPSLLDVVGKQHSPTCGSSRHDIGVIPEDG